MNESKLPQDTPNPPHFEAMYQAWLKDADAVLAQEFGTQPWAAYRAGYEAALRSAEQPLSAVDSVEAMHWRRHNSEYGTGTDLGRLIDAAHEAGQQFVLRRTSQAFGPKQAAERGQNIIDAASADVLITNVNEADRWRSAAYDLMLLLRELAR